MTDTLALASLIGLSVGIALGSSYIVVWPVALFFGCIALFLVGAWFFGRREAYLVPAVFLLFLALGCGRTLLVPRTLPPVFAEMLGHPVSLTGTVVTDPDIRESSQRLTVEVEQDGERTKVLSVADLYPVFEAGDRVVLDGTLEVPQPFSTDGARTFEYRMFLAKDGILGMVPHAHVERTGIAPSWTLRAMRALFSVKHAFAHALENALPEPHASLAEGLITGGKQGLGNRLLDAFTVAGLLPIVVLSGYNVMIVAESLLAALSFMPKKYALLFATLAVAAFVLAAGSGASALRAALMAGLALFARASGRTYDALRALLATFAFMIVASPLSLLYDPGLQFSFLATLGLVLCTNPFSRFLLWIRPTSLREIVSSTLAAQLFVLPLLLYQTGNLSIVSVAANAFVLPFVPLAMGLSALAGCVALIFPASAVFVGLPAYAALSYIIGAAEAFARLPFAHLLVPAFSALFLVPAYAFIAWLTVHIRRAAPASGAALLNPEVIK